MIQSDSLNESGEQHVSWDEFKTIVAKLKDKEKSAPVLFRGQASSSWLLETTLERSGHDEAVMSYYRLISRIKTEIEVSTDRKWPEDISITDLESITKSYDGFSRAMMNLPYYAYMAYLRHHGFPSPLLDWTLSPFIAAYFAFRDDRVASNGDQVAIFAFIDRVGPMKMSSSDDAQIHHLGPYVASHKRQCIDIRQYKLAGPKIVAHIFIENALK